MNAKAINELINSLKAITVHGDAIIIPADKTADRLELKDHSYYFWVDINRKGHRLKKLTLQLREQQRKELPLLRLDIYGPPHQNPEGDFPLAGEIIPCPHIHIAHPEYGISIAYPLNNTYAKMLIPNVMIDDALVVVKEFLRRCNVGNIDDYTYTYQTELL
ncbi:hypothetical protein [Sporosarcina sp. OR05]|uniref:DUF6978 family protein n=1 Tax=Sporosarcina sp. OR05 TaxID=2969819 RepID=UPI00352BC666